MDFDLRKPAFNSFLTRYSRISNSEMEAEAWKALKQAAIRFELKTGIGQLKKTRYSRLDFKVIEILGAFIIVILTIKKD